jgi:hypothetical protein
VDFLPHNPRNLHRLPRNSQVGHQLLLLSVLLNLDWNQSHHHRRHRHPVDHHKCRRHQPKYLRFHPFRILYLWTSDPDILNFDFGLLKSHIRSYKRHSY